ncbi:glycosyltransferase [Congregibacter brevis]|uniref:Glycosyltransferase n=1 Tax=Congregibacter brevis TaxID=3081201 RepID=A0ABZ0IGX2_9GAMM|nr:glycosyltransferase [Congregibacter sp. IMCC45268]
MNSDTPPDSLLEQAQPSPLEIDVSCIVITWNSAAYIEKCLNSVLSDLESTGLSYELIVVDNGSTDDTSAKVLSIRPDTDLISLGRNTGTTFSRNIALRRARGNFLLICDSDVEILEFGVVSRLLGEMHKDKMLGIACPGITYGSGNHQKSYDVFPTLLHKLKRLFFLRKMESSEAQRLSAATRIYVDYAISAFWLLRKSTVEEIGLFDEKIFYAPEDVDYCARVWLSGHTVAVFTSDVVVHHAQEISRQNPLSVVSFSHLAGLMYWYRKEKAMFSTKALRSRIEQARALATLTITNNDR